MFSTAKIRTSHELTKHSENNLPKKFGYRIYEPFPSELQSDAVFINPAVICCKDKQYSDTLQILRNITSVPIAVNVILNFLGLYIRLCQHLT